MAELKILQVITLSETGGAQKVLYHLVAGLSPASFDVTVACAPGGELVRWLRELGWVRVVEVPHLRREISLLRDTAAFLALYRLMRRERFDVVHCHSSKAGILGRLAARLAGVKKVIFTAHGWGITPEQGRLERFFYTWVERLVGLASTWVVCVSRADWERGVKERLAPAAKLKVIYNGVPPPGGAEKGVALRAELGLPDDALVVGTVGRLCAQKDPLFFLEVARRLLSGSSGDAPLRDDSAADSFPLPAAASPPATVRREFPELSAELSEKLFFILIGDGPLRQECLDFIDRYDLRRRIFLLGAREDAARLLAGFDVFCLFSRWEGLPLAILEAMQRDRPVAAAAVGGVPELVREGETGFLVPPGAVGKAVRAVAALLKDPGLRQRMGEAGRRAVREKFSLEEMVAGYQYLYLA
ncbi:MAG: glycosyltransferase family 4 protein [Armatimonadetes bacterium]|nr:glycosyltransferase family 4 protein [Armatimonadota bacterium]